MIADETSFFIIYYFTSIIFNLIFYKILHLPKLIFFVFINVYTSPPALPPYIYISFIPSPLILKRFRNKKKIYRQYLQDQRRFTTTTTTSFNTTVRIDFKWMMMITRHKQAWLLRAPLI